MGGSLVLLETGYADGLTRKQPLRLGPRKLIFEEEYGTSVG